MSTEYYWFPRPVCIHCGVAAKPIHIGLSAYGWAFQLHVYPNVNEDDPLSFEEKKITNAQDWFDLFELEGSYIEDEYCRIIPKEEMKQMILDKSHVKYHAPEDDKRCIERTDSYDLIKNWVL